MAPERIKRRQKLADWKSIEVPHERCEAGAAYVARLALHTFMRQHFLYFKRKRNSAEG